jgi:DNA-binding NarL/FixJ family response regulator
VIFEATTASAALKAAREICPDVILLDIGLGSENGLKFIAQLIRDFNPVRVLVVTATEEVETHLSAMEAGASGVVTKEQAPEILVQAIRAVNAGEPWMGRALSVAALKKLVGANSEKTRMDPEVAKIATLTPREREVVGAVACGFNGPRIASEFGISEATVRHHITSILSKLDVSNKLELAVYAFRHGLRSDQSRDTTL